MTRKDAPVADWVTIPDLYRDPFPIYDRLRAEGGVHWVPAVNRYLVTSYDAVHETELDQQTFSANEQGSLQIRAMGHSMLRRDDPEHYIERKAWQPALRPGVVKRVWTDIFRQNAERYLAELAEKRSGADLVWDFAAPYAAENLRQICGLYNVQQEDMQRWSQTMIDATGNYADDPEVWRLGEQSYNEVDTALDEMLAWHAKHPDHSLISQLLRTPDYEMPVERIRANLKMTIGGGLNEPRDALGVAALALLQHPDQLAAARADASLWHTVFDETIRWVAPIGMYSRQTTREVVLGEVTLPAGARLGICILSANRDTVVWDDAASFDIRREQKPHLAFGKGVHVCLGAWVARAEIADVALPLLFDRLEGLRFVDGDPAEMGGWVFRGMTKMPVAWDRVLAGESGGSGGVGGTGVAGGAGAAAGSGAGAAALAPAVQVPSPRIAIVGSGPSGCFTAQALRKVFPAAPIEVIDRLATPYGLVRYGVAADHQGTKAVARQFDRLFTEEGVEFRGNVRLGADVSLEALRAAYDVVVLATGMHGDAQLAVPGAALARGAGAVTRLLNGHPDEPDAAPLGERVVVIGHGNVAIDIARLLARDAEGLEGSDIDDSVHGRLAGRVRTIHLVGRSLPASAKFDPVMVRELASLPGVQHVVHGAGELPDDGRDARIDAVRALVSGSEASDETARVRIEWWFGLTPTAIEGGNDTGAGGNGADRQGDRDGHGAVATVTFTGVEGEPVRIDADDVITAVGFAQNADSPVGAAAHPDGRVEAGLYVAGWLRRGPRGTIPDQRADARGLAQLIADDVRSGGVEVDATVSAGAPAPEPTSIVDQFVTHAATVDFDGWRRIDLRERLAAAPGRERVKLRSHAEMLEAASDLTLELPAIATDAALAATVPVTILFGTESGGAELVADELHRLLDSGTAAGGAAGVEVRDLAETEPGDLAPGRLHLIVCSTYGDGEVPTSARPFYEALRDPGSRLDGVRYAMFGMGDRSYEKTYSRGSELIDEALAARGASRVGEYGRHDAGRPISAAEAAVDWVAGVLAEVTAAAVA